MISTTIDQSRHLLELGLDPTSADMWWSNRFVYWSSTPMIGVATEQNQLYTFKWCEEDIPAWSLSALLEVMPIVNEGWPVCCKIYGSEKWHVLYYSTAVTPKIDSGEYDTPIEAAYELVCCLLEQGLIKKGGNQ